MASPTVDRYDPATNTMTTLPNSATRNLGWYPRLHLLANGLLIKSGPGQRSLYFDPVKNSWLRGPDMTFGNRQNGASVLLMGSTRVLAFGGHTSTGTAPATATAELLDVSAATPAWRPVGSMKFPRIHACGVVLPDGSVLALGGGASEKYVGPVKAAELFDPATETWTELAPQSVQRMYHSTAVLLPDARVLSAGSDYGTQRNTGEIFSPPYLFKGPRPVITGAPDNLRYGQNATVTTDVPVATMVLVRPCAVTHQVDSDQRLVSVSFNSVGTTHTVAGPINSAHAPAGYYMLFALDAAGVPSVAAWVKVG